MPNSTAVAEREQAALPALAATPALDISAEDVSLPRLYMGQPGGEAVKDGMVPAHCLWIGLSSDDPEPNVIHELGGDGVVVHVLQMYKSLSKQDDNDELMTWRFGDPDAPDDADVCFNYVLCLPEVERDVPVKLLLKRTSAKTAKRINFQLMKHAQQGPAHALQFRLTTKDLSKGKYRWTEMVSTQVEDVDPEHVAIADRMVRMLDSSDLNTGATADLDEPTI